METKHTPGEWEAINKSTHTGDYFCVISRSVSICNIITRDDTQAQANAKLIAAAPELLEALKKAQIIIWNAKYYEAMQWAQNSELAKEFADNHQENKDIEDVINKATI